MKRKISRLYDDEIFSSSHKSKLERKCKYKKGFLDFLRQIIKEKLFNFFFILRFSKIFQILPDSNEYNSSRHRFLFSFHSSQLQIFRYLQSLFNHRLVLGNMISTLSPRLVTLTFLGHRDSWIR